VKASSDEESGRLGGVIVRLKRHGQDAPHAVVQLPPPISSSQPLRVINISGCGRSGSTLLAQLLDRYPEVVSLGEARDVWRRGYLANLLCSCRQPFQDCPFWHAVDERAFGGLPTEVAQQVGDLTRSVVRKRRWPTLAIGAVRQRPAPDTARWLEYVAAVFGAALVESGASFVVDATKDPMYGLTLAQMPNTQYHVVHLIRDPRGTVFSWQRAIDSGALAGTVQEMGTVGALKSASTWRNFNLLAHMLRPVAASYTMVRYEDLVERPDEVLSRIEAAVGLSSRPESLGSGDVTVPLSHAIAGNLRRRFGGQVVRLRADEEWKRALSRKDMLTTSALCWPLMLAYRYRLLLPPTTPGSPSSRARGGPGPSRGPLRRRFAGGEPQPSDRGRPEGGVRSGG
jgi:Sulfotransferase family